MSAESKIRVVAVDDDRYILEAIKAILTDHPRIELAGTGTSGREALQLCNSLKPDVVVLDVQMPGLNGIEAAERIASVFPSIGVVILTSQETPETLKAALRAGAKEFLGKSNEIQRLPEAILLADRKRDRQAASRALCSLWAFYSTKGSAGTTTLATNVACDLAAMNYRVLLVDLDAMHGDCAFSLGMPARKPEKTLLGQLEQIASVGPDTIRSHALRFGLPGRDDAGLDVLDSPCSLQVWTQDADARLMQLLDIVTTMYDYVIVDLPPGQLFDPSIVIVMDYCERLFVVASRNLPSLKSLLGFVGILGGTSFSLGKLTLLISSLLEQEGVDILEFLAQRGIDASTIQGILHIPRDDESCGRALIKGQPVLLAVPASPVSNKIRELVDTALNLPAARPRSSGLWGDFKRLLAG